MGFFRVDSMGHRGAASQCVDLFLVFAFFWSVEVGRDIGVPSKCEGISETENISGQNTRTTLKRTARLARAQDLSGLMRLNCRGNIGDWASRQKSTCRGRGTRSREFAGAGWLLVPRVAIRIAI